MPSGRVWEFCAASGGRCRRLSTGWWGWAGAVCSVFYPNGVNSPARSRLPSTNTSTRTGTPAAKPPG
jgi:hypothetical protein